jgi:hypothetical protein
MAKSRYSKNEFLYARPIASALLTDMSFREWFLAGTKFAAIARKAYSLAELQSSLRTTPVAKKWFWFNVFCPKDGSCECRGEKGIETDILLIFKSPDKSQFAVHVEVKPPNEGFLPDQAESYPRRGACWANTATRPRTVVAHDNFTTVLVCGENLRSDLRRSKFDYTWFHRDIEKHLSPYPDVVDFRSLVGESSSLAGP